MGRGTACRIAMPGIVGWGHYGRGRAVPCSKVLSIFCLILQNGATAASDSAAPHTRRTSTQAIWCHPMTLDEADNRSSPSGGDSLSALDCEMDLARRELVDLL